MQDTLLVLTIFTPNSLGVRFNSLDKNMKKTDWCFKFSMLESITKKYYFYQQLGLFFTCNINNVTVILIKTSINVVSV